MSRVKAFKRMRKRQESTRPSVKQQTKQIPIDTQLKMLFTGIGRMAEHLSELELMIEFAMRYIKLKRPKSGGLIIEGREQFEELTLLQFFEQQRDAFAEALQKERHEAIRAELIAKGIDPDSVNGDSTAHDEREGDKVIGRITGAGAGSEGGRDVASADTSELPQC